MFSLVNTQQQKHALIVWEGENGFATDNSQSWGVLQFLTMEDIPVPLINIDTGRHNLIGAAATAIWGSQ